MEHPFAANEAAAAALAALTAEVRAATAAAAASSADAAAVTAEVQTATAIRPPRSTSASAAEGPSKAAGATGYMPSPSRWGAGGGGAPDDSRSAWGRGQARPGGDAFRRIRAPPGTFWYTPPNWCILLSSNVSGADNAAARSDGGGASVRAGHGEESARPTARGPDRRPQTRTGKHCCQDRTRYWAAECPPDCARAGSGARAGAAGRIGRHHRRPPTRTGKHRSQHRTRYRVTECAQQPQLARC